MSARAAQLAKVKAAQAEEEKAAKAPLAPSQGQMDDEEGLAELQMERLSKQTESAPVDTRTPQQREGDSKAQIHLEAISILKSPDILKH